MRAQTSMILLIVVLLIFLGLITILLSLSSTVIREEYSDLYVNNLLLSVLKTNTGYGDRCETVSDLITCAFLTPSYVCRGSPKPCLELANETLKKYMGLINENMRYFFTVRSASSEWIPLHGKGALKLEFGDPSLERERRIPKRVANTIIEKLYHGTEYLLEAKLIVSFATQK